MPLKYSCLSVQSLGRSVSLFHGTRQTKVWEHSPSLSQAVYRNTCSLLLPQTIGMLWNYHHLSTIVCLRKLNTCKVLSVCKKFTLPDPQKTMYTGEQVTCTTEYWIWWESDPPTSEQVSHCDDAAQPQWRVSLLLLSTRNTSSVLSMETKTSPRLSKLFPPVHCPLNSVFLRLFLTQTRFSWFWHEVMRNSRHI